MYTKKFNIRQIVPFHEVRDTEKLEVPQEQVIQFLKDGRLKFDPHVKHVIKIYKLDVRRLNQELLKERSIC